MTGEMIYIDQETGEDQDGNVWIYHLAIAKALGGTLKPFDMYQGPYIVFGEDLTAGNSPYAMPIQGLGIIRLWITSDGSLTDMFSIYREDTDESIPFWPCEEHAIESAKEILRL